MFFFLIWGFRSKPKVLGGYDSRCSHCGKKTLHGVLKVSKYFTFFFIPLIPLSKKVFVVCEACGAKAEIKGELKEKLLEKLEKK
jgi:hypothetical protein